MKQNLVEGDVLIVDDFAQNYLCEHQNEPQGLHWVHQQGTIHPSVAMYPCMQQGCNKLVMHEVVHLSDDLKHNAHIVKNFRTRTVEALRKNNVEVRKLYSLQTKLHHNTKIKQHSTIWLKMIFPLNVTSLVLDMAKGHVMPVLAV